jgi:hypothetical protein
LPFAAKRFRTTAMAILSIAALGVGLIVGLGPAPSGASSHREAPLVAADPQVDTTDLYAFVSPDKPDTVTLIANWIPFEEPAGGPNFYSFAPGVRYEIRIDNSGDAGTDIIYRWVFTNHYRNPNTFLYNTGPVTSLDDADLNFYQTYSLTEINFETGKTRGLLSNALVVPSDVGATSMPNYSKLMAQGVRTIERGTGRTWAGQADDPFFLDLRVFDLLYGPPNFSEAGDDTLAGFGVNSVALQVPKSDLALKEDAKDNPVIGVWTGTFRQSTRVQTNTGSVSFSGSYVDVSRLGMPLVNELVVPVGLKDYFNASNPINDAQFLGAVDDPELPHLINAVYGLPVPDSDPNTTGIQRADLIQVFLTGIDGLNNPNLNEDVTSTQPSEMLRLNMSIPPCTDDCSALGVLGGDLAGFPNGRRLSDDIIDSALRVTEGILLPNHNPAVDTLGDGVDQNDKSFQGSFPYLASPAPGSNPNPHSAQQARD